MGKYATLSRALEISMIKTDHRRPGPVAGSPCHTGADRSRDRAARFPAIVWGITVLAVSLWMIIHPDRTVGPAAADIPKDTIWDFDEASPGTLPRAFAIGTLFDGRAAGDWKILITTRAKSASQVLAQLMPKGADQVSKLVLIDQTITSNVDLEVSFLSVSGKADMGGGVIWRARDDRNYYLLRASAVEQNIRLYRVVKGVRQLLKTHGRTVDQREWHTLRVMQHGCEIQVRYDDEPIFQLCDNTFPQGRIGLWTTSDAVTYFDDLHLRSLDD